VGNGNITAHQIVLKLAAQEETTRQVVGPAAAPKIPTSAVQVQGVGDLMTSIASCCNPSPGDKIIGYITRSRGVSIHRQDCHNILSEDEKERLIPVEWGHADLPYSAKIQVDAWDRVGLMRDVSTLVAEEKVNIASMNLTNCEKQRVSMVFTLQTKGLPQLSDILKKIDAVEGVISVSRIDEETPGQKPGGPTAAMPKTGDDGGNKN
jgi:GTP pyrophosphokinase